MNSEMMMNVFLAIIKTFLFFGIGAFAYYRKFIDDGDLSKLGRLAVDLLLPFLTFTCIVNNFSPDQGNVLWQLPLLGFGIMLFGALAGYPLKYLLKEKTPSRMMTFHHLAITNNFLFLPLIVLDSIFGVKAAAYLFVMSVGSTIAFWTLGTAVFSTPTVKNALKHTFSPNTIAVFIALIFVFCGWTVPPLLKDVFEDLGDTAIPLSLLLIGASLYCTGGRLFDHPRDAILTTVLRLFILPVATALILKLLPLDPLTYNVALVVAIMPASCTSVLIVKKYGGCSDFAGQSIFFTTIISMVSIPLLLYLLS